MVNPKYQGAIDITVNEYGDVEITVNGKTFTADLMFMNQFALCKGCGEKRQWEYSYPPLETEDEPAAVFGEESE